MWFLTKFSVVLCLVLLILPIEPEGYRSTVDRVGPVQAAYAVREAWRDTSGLCERRPDVCETGKAAIAMIGVRAREGARMAYEYLDDIVEPQLDEKATGSVKPAGN